MGILLITFFSLLGVLDILNQLCEEMQYKCNSMSGADNSDQEGGDKYGMSEDVADLIRQIAVLTEKIARNGKKTVIVIDGLDKVIKQSKTEKVIDAQ